MVITSGISNFLRQNTAPDRSRRSEKFSFVNFVKITVASFSTFGPNIPDISELFFFSYPLLPLAKKIDIKTNLDLHSLEPFVTFWNYKSSFPVKPY
jgi:hypothetical protein